MMILEVLQYVDTWLTMIRTYPPNFVTLIICMRLVRRYSRSNFNDHWWEISNLFSDSKLRISLYEMTIFSKFSVRWTMTNYVQMSPTSFREIDIHTKSIKASQWAAICLACSFVAFIKPHCESQSAYDLLALSRRVLVFWSFVFFFAPSCGEQTCDSIQTHEES